ncbi:Sensor histidine kinase YpdA [Kordia antarctica]|uniref:Sensor histidine kinase YpdA n=1 Tax=Kordia antarctica TaxID=1218801 RepID=A0A7L4ZL08_9FLAO|nr:histidine kinase [Kordia antarctica]QHI37408.1 Sensor histidine kinase YpdA [Kordia antarctica]
MRIYIVIIGFLIPILLYSQEIDVVKEHREIDSIKTILTDANTDTNRNNYIRVITFYARRNIDSSKIYVAKYAKLTQGSTMHFDAISRKIYILQLEKKYDEAVLLIEETIQQNSEELNKPENKYALLKFYGALAEIYFDQIAYEKALEIYYKTASIYENEGVEDEINYYLTLHNISSILSLIGYEERGLEYCDKLEILLTEKIAIIDKSHRQYFGVTVINIHNHINKADIYERLNQLPKAIIYAKKAEALSIAEKQHNLLPKIYSTLGNMYIASKDYENAIQNGLKALELEKLYNYPEFKDTFLHAVGIGYLGLKDYEKAIPYLEKALEETNVETGKVPVLNDLAKAYQELKNYKKANEVLLLHNKLKDTVYNQSQEKAIAEITEKYENEKKQKEITFLNTESELQQLKIHQQSYIIYGIAGLIMLLLILGIVWYKTRQQKQKFKEAIINLDKEKLQQRFLRTQLNPHFFFHALTAIEGYIYKEEKETAALFLQKFGALMRTILESSDIDFIPLETDIDFIEKYLALQSLNHATNFTYTISLAEELNSSKIMIPPMLIQPFVENAIIHGISSIENGHITIAYTKEATFLRIQISDNGKGMTTEPKKSGMLHRSMSTDIIKQRIENIQKVHGMEIQYKILTDKNTTVIFTIPLKYGNFSIV